MKYGHFDVDRREYVIERPDTPFPWINYLGTRDYFGIVSNTGGGYSFYSDARLRRILRYRYNNIPADEGGRYLFIRHADGDFWCPTWQPARKPLDSYECRHGLGYTCIRSSRRGVTASIVYFVPVADPVEIWQVVLENGSEREEDLTLFSFVEFCLWDALDDQTNFQRNLNIGEVEVDGGVIYHTTEYRERRDHFAFFATSGEVAGFDTDREAFLGPYGSLSAPRAVVEGRAADSIAYGWFPIGSHCLRLRLRPGERRPLVFVLGLAWNRPEEKFTADGLVNKAPAREVMSRYLDPGMAEASREELSRYWDSLLGRFQAETPDAGMSPVVNVWNQYQCITTFNLARSASYYESGISRGIGFRDGSQDVLGALHQVPEAAKTRLRDLASIQFAAGNTYHQYSPLTKQGNNDIGSGFNDDPMWLVIATAQYLKETGDLEALSIQAPFADDPRPVRLEEHLRRCMSYALANLGPHGLPLIGEADWNDCLNLNWASVHGGRVAESVLIGELFVRAASEMAKIAHVKGNDEEAAFYTRAAREMAAAINAHAWDGRWYVRAFDDRGTPVGSSKSKEGRIFLETQPWSVMSGVAPRERGLACMDSVWAHLATPHGIVLQQPAFTRYSEAIGACTCYPPGVKENAGIFCHPNTWAIIAECMLGRGDRAYSYYSRLLPTTREAISEVHRAEPYVYAQMIAGPDCPRFGEAKNSWLTGTASWMFVVASQWILGIRPEYDGLIIDPCIPPEWPGFSVKRVFRGHTYHIRVENPDRVSRGVVCLELDGRELEPAPADHGVLAGGFHGPHELVGFIPIPPAPSRAAWREHSVRVVMGRACESSRKPE
ncbi:MAG: GH36-type glycosyl hydrolase domain-containing protein [Bacteroidota bacterium]